MHTLIKSCRMCSYASKNRFSRKLNINNLRYSSSVTESNEKEQIIQSHSNTKKYFSFMKNLFTGKMDTVSNTMI